ncbi:hypothetical protein BJF91_20405 [Allorhizobium taibaishanense]|nr:hypothetical protein BJF91_20405 [Allorhizobium taibaishanense]
MCTALAIMPLIVTTEPSQPLLEPVSTAPQTESDAKTAMSKPTPATSSQQTQTAQDQTASTPSAPTPATPSPLPQQQPSAASSPSLSPNAVAPAAIAPEHEPAAAALSSEIAEADQHCKDGQQSQAPLVPPPPRPAIILGFLTPAQSEHSVEITQAKTNVLIDPAYRDNLRASVHPVNAPKDAKTIAIIPKGMNVHMGDQVAIVGWHASPTLACRYVPNSVVVR